MIAASSRKARRYSCSHEGCTNRSRKGGVCHQHGAKFTVKRCSYERPPFLPLAMMTLDSVGDKNVTNNNGGESMDSREQERGVDRGTTSPPRRPIIWFRTRMWQRGAFVRLCFLSQVCESRSTGPRGPPRLANLRQKSQICDGFSENLRVLWRV